MPKFFGVASKRGFFWDFDPFDAPKGAGAGFFPVFFAGAWSLRREVFSQYHVYTTSHDTTKRLGALTFTLQYSNVNPAYRYTYHQSDVKQTST